VNRSGEMIGSTHRFTDSNEPIATPSGTDTMMHSTNAIDTRSALTPSSGPRSVKTRCTSARSTSCGGGSFSGSMNGLSPSVVRNHAMKNTTTDPTDSARPVPAEMRVRTPKSGGPALAGALLGIQDDLDVRAAVERPPSSVELSATGFALPDPP